MFEAGKAESKQTQDPTETVFLIALQVLPAALMNSQEPDGQQNSKQGKKHTDSWVGCSWLCKKNKKIKFPPKKTTLWLINQILSESFYIVKGST